MAALVARRALRTARPARVAIRARNPCFLARRRLFGWNVRFTQPSFAAPSGGAAGNECVRPRPEGDLANLARLRSASPRANYGGGSGRPGPRPFRPRRDPGSVLHFPAAFHTLWTTLWTDQTWRKVTQVDEHDQVWTAVAQILRAQVSEAVWRSTFQDVTPLEGDGLELPRQRPQQPRQGPDPDPLPAPRARRAGGDRCRRHPVRDRGADPGRVERRAALARAGPGVGPPRRRRPARRAGPLRRRRDEPPLHVRGLRQGRLQPVRAGGRAPRRRDARPLLQPAVHLRRRRSRQDPPAARHRPLRAPRTTSTTSSATSPPRRSSTSSSTRSAPTPPPASSAATATSTSSSSTTSSSWRARRSSRRSSSTPSTRCTVPTSRSSSPVTACPTPSPRSRNASAAGSSGA